MVLNDIPSSRINYNRILFRLFILLNIFYLKNFKKEDEIYIDLKLLLLKQ
jgi:hypothetical protein